MSPLRSRHRFIVQSLFKYASSLHARTIPSPNLLGTRGGTPQAQPTAGCRHHFKIKRPAPSFEDAGLIPGDDLLSQGLSPHYHRRSGVSLPGSEWDRVVPPRCGHQRPRFARHFRASGFQYWKPILETRPLATEVSPPIRLPNRKPRGFQFKLQSRTGPRRSLTSTWRISSLPFRINSHHADLKPSKNPISKGIKSNG